jgi:hypothetical protein
MRTVDDAMVSVMFDLHLADVQFVRWVGLLPSRRGVESISRSG